MPSTDADALASWGGGQDLSAWEALMWRTGGDHRTRSTGVIVELLDQEPDWERLVAAHDRFTQHVPRLRERVVEPALPVVPPAWSPDPHFDLDYFGSPVPLYERIVGRRWCRRCTTAQICSSS